MECRRSSIKKYWNIVGDNACNVRLSVLNGNGELGSLNKTLITLIPKINHTKRVLEFHPISLCNVIYKIISKTLAMRMKKVLPYVISEYQSVFIPNRMILDNVLAAFETIHCLKRRGKRGRKKLALKLDMAKAYDRVEWAYLEKMMYKIEFPSRFVALVMNCVTSVSYFILMNDRPHNTITPSGESGKVTQYPRICS